MKKSLVIFDVDNTLVNGQSQKLLLRYLFNNKYISTIYYLKLFFWFLLYKFGLLNNPRVAMEYGFSFIKNRSVDDMERITNDFFVKVLLNNIFKESLKIINDHKNSGREIILVSNAPDIIIKKLSKQLGVNYYLSTRLEVNDRIYTGNILGEIMYGKQKLIEIEKFAAENNFSLSETWAYADHDSDIYLLEKVKYPYVVNPTNKLLLLAKKNKWPVLKFKI